MRMGAFFFIPLLCGVLAFSLLAPVEVRAAGALAVEQPGTASISWQPLISNYERLILSVSGPTAKPIEREFPAGAPVVFNLVSGGAAPCCPDGRYTYDPAGR